MPLEKRAVWNPHTNTLETEQSLENIQVILWKLHCSIHAGFTVQHTDNIRQTKSNMRIIVHPKCSRQVNAAVDDAGSTKYIIDMHQIVQTGTEMNLVNRIIKQNSDKHIISFNENCCFYLTMNRIDLSHLLWSLESIDQGHPHNRI